MTWVLKAIMAVFFLAVVWGFRFFYLDWDNTRKSQAYEDITPFEKIRFNAVFLIVFMSLLSLAVFLIYFILSSVTVSFELW
jgi:hypothetical protein